MLTAGAVAPRHFGLRIYDVIGEPRADGQNRARPLAGPDEHVLGPWRAMHEVPGLEPPLPSLGQEQTLAGEDEEVLLLVLAVIHARRLA
jgi:hypothetical protein